VVLREGARKRSISKLEGIVLKQIESALKGNEKAALATLKMAAQVGLLEAPEGAGETPTLSASEQEMGTSKEAAFEIAPIAPCPKY
jgi:hypothetical protein